MSDKKSAALADSERTANKLKEENTKLRRELHEIKSLYSQLVLESEKESFDERRVLMLKSQLIQMERQLLLLNEALSNRSVVQLEIENAMANIANTCRRYICLKGQSSDVLVPRSELMLLVENCESVRSKLTKTIQVNNHDSLMKPLAFINGFVNDKCSKEYSLFDVCSGKLEHINLKHVSKLESDLCHLYRAVISVENMIATSLIQKNSSDPLKYLPKASVERQYIKIQKTAELLQNTCEQLLNLSILLPAAPLPAFQPKVKDLTVEKILSSLPTSVRNKQDTKHVIEALMKSLNHSAYMKTLEIDALKDELLFHQSIYEHQCRYMDDLFDAMKLGYGQFESNAVEYLVKPMEEIFLKYESLKIDASETALRDFLTVFKLHVETLKSVISNMKPNHTRATLLSDFAEKFFSDLLIYQDECGRKRDNFVEKLDSVRRQSEENAELLQVLLNKPIQNASTIKPAKLEYDNIVSLDKNVESEIEVTPDSVASGKTLSRKRNEDSSIQNIAKHEECVSCTAGSNCDIRTGQNVNTPSSSDESPVVSKEKKQGITTPKKSITGSTFPRPSESNIPRTPAGNSRQATPAAKPTTGSSARSSTPTLIPGLPIRTLKLKK